MKSQPDRQKTHKATPALFFLLIASSTVYAAPVVAERQHRAQLDTGGAPDPFAVYSKPFGGRLPIDVTTMADFDDHDDKITILNLVQDSVVPLSETVLVAPRCVEPRLPFVNG